MKRLSCVALVYTPLIQGAMLALTSCTGILADPSGTGPNGAAGPGGGIDVGSGPLAGGTPSAGYVVPATSLRRLTRREYDNTVRDLLGDTTAPANAFADDPVGVTGYETPGSLGALEVEAFMQAAEALANGKPSQLVTLVGCTPASGAEEEPCAVQFIQSFGEKAYRRPLLAEEASDLLTLYQEVRQIAGVSFADGIAAVIQGTLQSPNFLYHREWGAQQPVLENGELRLTSNELASRLSFFIAGTMPDAELLKAAKDGLLTDPAVLEAQARRLAGAPGAVAESISDFVRQWLQLDVAHLEKSPTAYPEFAAVQPLLASELGRFIGHVVKQGLPPSALLTDPTVFVNRTSAAVYGVPVPDSDVLVPIAADPRQRAGVFTQLAFLSTHSTSVGSHPVKRGKVIFERVLCGVMPPPPPNVPPPAAPQPGQTTRERFALHEENACAGCHRSLDPPGFALENYDGIGRYRTTEAGKSVDASGALTLPSGQQVAFQNGVELMSQLATSVDVRSCLTRHLARYGAIVPEGSDAEVAAELVALPESSGSLVDVYVSIVKSKAFRYRALAEGETL